MVSLVAEIPATEGLKMTKTQLATTIRKSRKSASIAIDEIENRFGNRGDLHEADLYLDNAIAWLQQARMELNELVILQNKKGKVLA